MCGCQGNKTPAIERNVTLPTADYVTLRYQGFRGGINPYPGANGGYRFGTQKRTGTVTYEDAKRLLAIHEGGKPAFDLVIAEPEEPDGEKSQEHQGAEPTPITAPVKPASAPHRGRPKKRR